MTRLHLPRRMTSEGALGWAIATFVLLQAVALAAIVVLVIATRSQGDRITRIERPTPKAQRQAIRHAIRNLPPDAARALLTALLENATRAQRAQLRAAIRSSRPARRIRPSAATSSATPSASSSSTSSTSHPPAAANRAPRPTRPPRSHKARPAPAPPPPPASSSTPPPTSSPPPQPRPFVDLPPGPAGVTLCVPPLGGLGCA